MGRVIDSFSGKQTWSQFQALVASAAFISLGNSSQQPSSLTDTTNVLDKEYRFLIADSSYPGDTSNTLAVGVASDPAFAPKTSLGKRLLELRATAIAKGMRLLAADEIHDEVARRRGEIV